MAEAEQLRIDASSTKQGRTPNVLAKGLAVTLIVANLAFVTYGSYQRFVTIGESKALVTGVDHCLNWDFTLFNRTPPLARILATFPILPSEPTVEKTWDRTQCPNLDLWLQLEDRVASDFATRMLPDNYLDMVRLSRLAGCGWWLIGAWVIVGWARRLYGGAAGGLALVLWAFGPNIVAAEGAIDSALPAAVIVALVTYHFGSYLREPHWKKVLGLGFLFGLALLMDYLLIGLIVALLIPWVVSRIRRGREGTSLAGITRGIRRAALAGLLCLWVIHSGYGPHLGWQPLKDFRFDSRALAGKTPSGRTGLHAEPSHNRFEGTKLGDFVIPAPADYVSGFDRWLAGVEGVDRERTPGARSPRFLITAQLIAARVPLGILAMILWAAVLAILRPDEKVSTIEKLTLEMPIVLFLACMGIGADLLAPERGLVLIAPFAIVGISRLGQYCLPWRWKTGSAVVALTSWAVVSSLVGSWGGRAYLNEAAGGSDSLQAQSIYGTRDGGADLLALIAWVKKHPEARSLGIAVNNAVDLKPFGLAGVRPPINPGPELARQPGYDPHFGPFPGYYAIDLGNLELEGYAYFRRFRPIAKIGSAIAIYHVTREGAERVRRELNLPPLERLPSASAQQHGFLQRTFRGTKGDDSYYTVFVPYSYAGDRPYPLILFLHGFGDRGSDGDQYLKVGLPVTVKAKQHVFDFIAVFPQSPAGHWTPDSWDAKRALAILKEVEGEYHVDRKRIYLTGLSSGASAVWEWAVRYPNRWAAIIPVATGGCDAQLASRVKDIPCWCFHNVNDVSSPAAAPIAMVTAMRREGGSPRYTEFFRPAVTPQDKHNAWDAAYGKPELYEWLLQQELPESGSRQDSKDKL